MSLLIGRIMLPNFGDLIKENLDGDNYDNREIVGGNLDANSEGHESPVNDVHMEESISTHGGYMDLNITIRDFDPLGHDQMTIITDRARVSMRQRGANYYEP